MITMIGIREVCARLGVGRATVYRMIRRGEFMRPTRLTPGRVMWPEHQVDRWLRERIGEDDSEAH